MGGTVEPRVLDVRKVAGIAGQYGYAVRVQYPGEDAQTVTFEGSTYGGPIVMRTPEGHELFVSSRVT